MRHCVTVEPPGIKPELGPHTVRVQSGREDRLRRQVQSAIRERLFDGIAEGESAEGNDRCGPNSEPGMGNTQRNIATAPLSMALLVVQARPPPCAHPTRVLAPTLQRAASPTPTWADGR